ncbi:helix-turn-helix domain-containing protein [Halosquirtibacter xylanolyticus]|uniref:helix-turn-helix domain-containing protein n=1 Tax=Halosquirtibacter xylanolyticus TaxID=3374599 RepID=UPI0037480F28|nr:helix-turn-helix domain-containing protein [Prolixibacteraceae bacterium]
MTSKKYLTKSLEAQPKRRNIEMLLREVLTKYDLIIDTMVQIIEMIQRSKIPPQRVSSKKELDKWIDTQDVLNLLHISRRKLQGMRLNGELPFTSFSGTILFKESDIYKLLEDNYGYYLASLKNNK